MNVEERHDAQRNILLRKLVSVRDIRRRDGEVKMPQGYTLRPSGASASMQDQGNVVGFGLGGRHSGGRRSGEMNDALIAHSHRERGNLFVRGGATREFRAYRRAKQNARVGVSQKKKKLLVGICQVQRS